MNAGENIYKSAHFLTLVVDEGEWLLSGPWQFTLGESRLLGTPRPSLGILEKIFPFFWGNQSQFSRKSAHILANIPNKIFQIFRVIACVNLIHYVLSPT
jgi:hypothetical protein